MSSPILLDTDVFSILWTKRPGHEEIGELLTDKVPTLSFVTVAEAHFGAAKAGWQSKRMRDLDDAIGRFLIFPYDAQLAVLWGTLKAQAAREAHPLGAAHHNNDMWICALAILHGLPLITKNIKHFTGFPGLNLVPLGA